MKEATVAIATLGCKANQYDSSVLEAQLKSRKFRLVDFKEKADIYVINTCTVTDRADREGRNLIHRAHRRNPDAFKVVTGCYAQTKPEEVAKVEGVDLVLGNDKKWRLFDFLEQGRPKDPLIEVDNIFRHTELESHGMASYSRNTRAFLKIQDGCNQFCSFCIIPFARGRNRSLTIAQVIDELSSLSEAGFHEAVLTGIHIGTYGHDLDEPTTLYHLLKEIELRRPIHRVRVSSIDPEEVNDEMVELFASAKVLCPHLHIPLQSGDDKILQMMRRRYSIADFQRLCDDLDKKVPRICIGTDVIVGFPYEDTSSFENTYGLLQEAPVHYFHVFPFSPKRGTPAAKMLGQVPHALKKERASQLRELSRYKTKKFRKKFLGQTVEVILETESKAEYNAQLRVSEWSGVSQNYLPVTVQTARGKCGELRHCVLREEREDFLVGKDDAS